MSLTTEQRGGDVTIQLGIPTQAELVSGADTSAAVGAAALNLEPFGVAQGLPLEAGASRGTTHGTGGKGGGNFDDVDTE